MTVICCLFVEPDGKVHGKDFNNHTWAQFTL